MKKLLITFLTLALVITPGSSIIFAQQNTTLLEAMSNVASLDDMKIVQSFYGRAEIEEMGEHISIKYRFTVNSAVDNDNSPSSFNRLNGVIKLYNHGVPSDSGIPFKELTINANAEAIVKNKVDLYLKLSNISFNTKQETSEMQADTESFREEMSLFTGTWFHTSIEELNTSDEIALEEYLAFENDFKEDPQQAILDFAEQALWDSGEVSTNNGMEEILEGIGLLLRAKLFNKLNVVSGNNKGFTFFSLNKSAVIELAKNFGDLIGEPLTDIDESTIRTGMSKFSLSGIFRITDDLLDSFVVRFKLREVEALKNLAFNYRFKLMDSETNNVVNTPSQYEELDTL